MNEENRLTRSDIEGVTLVGALLCHLTTYRSFIGLYSRDSELFVHVDGEMMLDTFGGSAVWEWRESDEFPIGLAAQVGGVTWFSLFTIERAAQCGCTLMVQHG